ncbi:MAG TPA: hypothetical protein IAA29_07050 [Candidatus Paenibacillus intestinavium]|nr:hypothetical protein [Candidatus Paenibacillus intestinavium]
MDKKNVIIVLLVLNLIVMLYFGNSLGKKIGNYQAQTSADMNFMQNNMMSLENRIINGVGNELRAQTDKIALVDYTVLDVDSAQKQAQVELKVQLKEVSPSAEIWISYSAQDDDQQQEVALVEQSGLIYGTKLTFRLNIITNLICGRKVLQQGKSN